METNKTKFLTKDYLAEQFYNYNKKYIIDDIKKNKQDNLEIMSNHFTWEENHKLGLNITNDVAAKPYDYLILEPWDDTIGEGKLRWDSPIDNQGDIKNGSKFLVNGNAIYNWKGSENITTLGQITTGSWKVGKLELFSGIKSTKEETYEGIGNFKIEFLNFSTNELKITGVSDDNGVPVVVVDPKIKLKETSITGKTDINGKTTISSSASGAVLTVNGQVDITGKLNGVNADFPSGFTAGKDVDTTISQQDTSSTVKGLLTVSKLAVNKSLIANCDASFNNVNVSQKLTVGSGFSVSSAGDIKADSVDAKTLSINTVKKAGTIREAGKLEDVIKNDFLNNSVVFENSAFFEADRIFIGSETDIVVIQKDNGDDYYKPIKINGKYIQLSTNNDVKVANWIAEM